MVPVDGEVAAIGGELRAYALALGDCNQRGVGDIHRAVAVLAHQRADTRHIGGAHRGAAACAGYDNGSPTNHPSRTIG